MPVDRGRTVCSWPTRRHWTAAWQPAHRCSRCPWCCSTSAGYTADTDRRSPHRTPSSTSTSLHWPGTAPHAAASTRNWTDKDRRTLDRDQGRSGPRGRTVRYRCMPRTASWSRRQRLRRRRGDVVGWQALDPAAPLYSHSAICIGYSLNFLFKMNTLSLCYITVYMLYQYNSTPNNS